MSVVAATLDGFAYGEDLEGLPPRSLGYRLLAPAQSAPWSDEVEALARRLQGAPYPEHWPATDLFCSVILADGRRLIALARYGLTDHTPNRRRGGLELIGVLAPADLDVPTALAVYRWLQTRRSQADDPHTLGGHFALADVLSAVAPAAAPSDPVPILPVRTWVEGALLFAATGPSDPDHRLGLLDQGSGRSWQWLPLVGPDFPLAEHARRGPLVAWTPHLAGVALRVDRKPELPAPAARISRSPLIYATAVALLSLVLLGINVWLSLSLRERLSAVPSPPASTPEPATHRPAPVTPPTTVSDESREHFAEALHDVLQEHVGPVEWEKARPHFLSAYDRLVRDHPDLRLKDTNVKGKVAVGALLVLSGRSADNVEKVMQSALKDRGYDPSLVKLAAESVRQKLIDDVRERP
jgi:hypothetical protein